jgi:hypothetical protein
LLNPATWKELAFFASIKADGDILPVRALYNETGETNIGMNPLTCKEPLWYAGPDLAASTLKTKRAPHPPRVQARGAGCAAWNEENGVGHANH